MITLYYRGLRNSSKEAMYGCHINNTSVIEVSYHVNITHASSLSLSSHTHTHAHMYTHTHTTRYLENVLPAVVLQSAHCHFIYSCYLKCFNDTLLQFSDDYLIILHHTNFPKNGLQISGIAIVRKFP